MEVLSRPATLWALVALAALSLLTTLTLPIIGEEGVYTMTTLEMWQAGEWIRPIIYGNNYGRPPALNWVIMPIAEIVGWPHVLLASRIVSAVATIATGLFVGWTARRLFGDATLAALAALAFFGYDTLARRGWLAYSDPLFSLCIFASIGLMWVAVHDRRRDLLWLSVLPLTLAFLTKALTCYAFYFVAAGVFLLRRDDRRFLLAPSSLAVFAVALALPLLWDRLLAGGRHGGAMVGDITRRVGWDLIAGLLAHAAEQPFAFLAATLPASAVAIYVVLRRRGRVGGIDPGLVALLALSVLINFIPYWISTRADERHFMPLYPMAALVFAYVVHAGGKAPVRAMAILAGVLVAVRIAAAWWFYPAYEFGRWGDIAGTARDIRERAGDRPLYVVANTAAGLSIAATIDSEIFPAPALVEPPEDFTDGYVITQRVRPEFGEPVKRYDLPSAPIYLMCKGPYCGETK